MAPAPARIGAAHFPILSRLGPDPNKRDATFAQRGLDFEDAVEVFAGATANLPDVRFDYPEPRKVTFGYFQRRLVVVVWTSTADGRRVISMRKANDRERRRYG